MAGALRHGLNQAGLHVFKHKKRILYISTVRPQLFDPNQAKVSAGLEAILATLRSYPRITRKQLAEKVLKRLLGEKSSDENSPEFQQAKNNLPTDLLWLAKAGHVIEFADGTLDLPLPPKAAEKPGGSPEAATRDVIEQEEPAEMEVATPLQVTEEPEIGAETATDQERSQERKSGSQEDLGPSHPAVEETSVVETVAAAEGIHVEAVQAVEDVQHPASVSSDSVPTSQEENISFQASEVEHPTNVAPALTPAAEEPHTADPTEHAALA